MEDRMRTKMDECINDMKTFNQHNMKAIDEIFGEQIRRELGQDGPAAKGTFMETVDDVEVIALSAKHKPLEEVLEEAKQDLIKKLTHVLEKELQTFQSLFCNMCYAACDLI